MVTKTIRCLTGLNHPVMLPRGSTRTDWEAKLVVVIGSRASRVGGSEALDHLAGYCVVNDVSEREYQPERRPTWDRGSCGTFGPVGPGLLTADKVGDPRRLCIDGLGGQRQPVVAWNAGQAGPLASGPGWTAGEAC